MTSLANRTIDTTQRSKTAGANNNNNNNNTTSVNFNFSDVADTLADFQHNTYNKLKESSTLPKLKKKREKSRDNKLYRCPSTPPNELLNTLERSFTLDCIAVGNISEDYSRTNPKLGSAIPPYDSQHDTQVKNYFNYFGVNKLLERTGQHLSHESIAGRVHDTFFRRGHATQYLDLRNKQLNGNGTHSEVYEGHERYMRDKLHEIFSYNNMYGYRRNVPKLRKQPSTFTNDVRGSLRINRSFKKHYNSQEISTHIKNTYLLGYPFHESDYRQFYPQITYLLRFKLRDVFDEKLTNDKCLRVNIVARTCDTGLVTLDRTIAIQNNTSDGAFHLFEKDKQSLFSFEYDDLRTINALVLQHDSQASKSMFITQIELELIKKADRKIFRFPFNGWLNAGKQNEKSEELKRRHCGSHTQNVEKTIILYPNMKPHFEYKIRTYPQLFSSSLYKIELLQCYVEDTKAPEEYFIELIYSSTNVSSNGSGGSGGGAGGVNSKLLPNNSILMKIEGTKGTTELIKINKINLRINESDIGDLKYIQLKLNKLNELFIKSIQITKSNQVKHLFEINEKLNDRQFKIYSSTSMEKLDQHYFGKKPTFNGLLTLRIEGDKSCTSYMKLNRSILVLDESNFVAKKYAQNVGQIKGVHMKFNGDTPFSVCHLNGIKIILGQEIFESSTKLTLKHNQEIIVPDGYEFTQLNKSDENCSRLFVNLIGDMNSSGYLRLEDARPGNKDYDEFIVDAIDLGQINKFKLKYLGENVNTKIYLNSIDIMDPWGKNYSFQVEKSFKSGQERLFPSSSSSTSSSTPEREIDESGKANDTSKLKTLTELKNDSSPKLALANNEYDENFDDDTQDLNKQIIPQKKTPSPPGQRQSRSKKRVTDE